MSEDLEENIEDNDEFEVLIEDDTPEEDRGKHVAPDENPPEEDEEAETEKELGSVGERVRKRIDKLTAEKHAERRRAEQIQRERDEAARALQVMMERERAYREQLINYEGGFVSQAKSRVEAELQQAKADFKSAFEQGDADKMAEAQDKIARLAPQHEQYSRYRAPDPKELEQQQPPAQPRQQAYDPRPDENLAIFMKENPWFNQDEEMTAYALGLHQRTAISNPEKVGTKEYYEEIAEKVKIAFGKNGADAPSRKPAAVAPATRGAPSKPARKQVTLTESQVRLAQRLGLTPKQYAEQLLLEGKA